MKKTKKKLTVHLEVGLHDDCQQAADAMGEPLSVWVRAALRQSLPSPAPDLPGIYPEPDELLGGIVSEWLDLTSTRPEDAMRRRARRILSDALKERGRDERRLSGSAS